MMIIISLLITWLIKSFRCCWLSSSSISSFLFKFLFHSLFTALFLFLETMVLVTLTTFVFCPSCVHSLERDPRLLSFHESADFCEGTVNCLNGVIWGSLSFWSTSVPDFDLKIRSCILCWRTKLLYTSCKYCVLLNIYIIAVCVCTVYILYVMINNDHFRLCH